MRCTCHILSLRFQQTDAEHGQAQRHFDHTSVRKIDEFVHSNRIRVSTEKKNAAGSKIAATGMNDVAGIRVDEKQQGALGHPV